MTLTSAASRLLMESRAHNAILAHNATSDHVFIPVLLRRSQLQLSDFCSLVHCSLMETF